MRLLRKSLLFGSLLAFLACSHNPALKEAERLLDSYPDSALVVLEQLPRESLSSERELAEYDYLSASAFYKAYYFLDDEHAMALSRAYRYKDAQRLRTSNLALLIMGILATLVLYFWARKFQTEKLLAVERAENEKMLSSAEDLRARLGALEKLGGRKNPSLNTLDRLCEQYYIYEGTENLQPKILKEVRSIVEGLRADAATQKELELSLDKSNKNVMSKLREQFPRWKEEDFRLFCFVASGFSATTISTLLGKDKPYVYNRLYRLKERVKNSSSPDKNHILACLEK